MYIINDTYFKSLNREVPNLDEADSKSFAELERLIDEKCRLLLFDFLTVDEVSEFDSYLVDGLFPIITTGIPQKWIDLVNGKEYLINDVKFKWKGLIHELGTYKESLLADYVYSFFLESNASYMTSVGDSKANPKGANLVNPTQRMVNTWNDFVKAYQVNCHNIINEVSLIKYILDQKEDFPARQIKYHVIKNQLGL